MLQPTEPDFKKAEISDYQRRRDKDPAITVSWIASATVGRQVPLNAFSCPFCKTTVSDHIRGTMKEIINAPLNVNQYSFSCSMRCKYCKQNYRFVYVEHEH